MTTSFGVVFSAAAGSSGQQPTITSKFPVKKRYEYYFMGLFGVLLICHNCSLLGWSRFHLVIGDLVVFVVHHEIPARSALLIVSFVFRRGVGSAGEFGNKLI